MSQVNAIGLNSAKSEGIVKSLNTLLSSYQIQYMNACGFHWNIKGRTFLNYISSLKKFITYYF